MNINIKIHLLSKYKWVETRFSKKVSSFTYYKKSDIEFESQWLEIISRNIHDKSIDILFPINVTEIRLLSKHQIEIKKLLPNFIAPISKSFDIANDKWELYKFLKSNQINTPQTYHSKYLDNDAVKELKLPVLLKPLQCSGGYGIKKITSKSTLKTFVMEEKEFIIQEYIHGIDFDMSVLCKDGNILAFSIQKEYMPNNEEFRPPYVVEFIYEDEVFNIVKCLMKGLNWSGLAHIDLRYDELNKRFNVIEINPRVWGSMELSKMVGVNFPYLYCLSSLTQTYQVPFYRLEKCTNKAGLVKILKSRLFRDKTRYEIPENTTILSDFKDPKPYIYNYIIVKLEHILNKKNNLFERFKHDVYCNFDTVLKEK